MVYRKAHKDWFKVWLIGITSGKPGREKKKKNKFQKVLFQSWSNLSISIVFLIYLLAEF